MSNALELTDINTSKKRFEDYVKQRATYYKKAYLKVMYKEIELMLLELVETTPADTGAAAGSTDRAKRSIYSSHPAKTGGFHIGNEVGQSGWQIIEQEDGFSLTNPMWDLYLKYLEFGIVHGEYQPHFVQRAWKNHLNRRRTMRRNMG